MIDKMIIVVKWEDDEGCEREAKLPGKYEVCDRCHGRGVHDRQAFSNGISSQDFMEDPDFAEDYFKGVYDVRCTVCGGKRVVLVPNEDNLNDEQKKILERYYENERAEADSRRECDDERRMGC